MYITAYAPDEHGIQCLVTLIFSDAIIALRKWLVERWILKYVNFLQKIPEKKQGVTFKNHLLAEFNMVDETLVTIRTLQHMLC